MKRQIRQGVFETNSSSMHSLVVKKAGSYYTPEEISEEIYVNKDGVWTLWEDDLTFGRFPFKALAGFKDKWMYACASLVKHYNDDMHKLLVSLALKYVPGLKVIEFPMTHDSVPMKKNSDTDDKYTSEYGKTEEELIAFLDQLEEKLGVDTLHYWETRHGYWHYEVPDTGCVDEDILSGFLDKEGITLEEFLTNKKYIVIQDGDEYGTWIDMKNAGLVNINAIDHEYPADDYEYLEEEKC